MRHQVFVAGMASSAPAVFSYSDTFGADLFEWWRLDLGVTLSTTNVKTVEGQHQGIILGNPDFGAASYPLFVAESSNLNNRPSARWDDATNNQLEINFGTTLIDEGVLLLVYYTPTFGTAGNALATGPIFGAGDSWFSLYSNTTFNIRDGSAGLALTADTATNWAGAHAAIAVFNEVTKGSVYRDGGTDLRVSIQSGYNDAVSWKGIVFGPGIFGWRPETNYELAEVAVLSGIPSNTAYNTWLDYVGTRYNLTTSPIS